jgi:hypothetical protein
VVADGAVTTLDEAELHAGWPSDGRSSTERSESMTESRRRPPAHLRQCALVPGAASREHLWGPVIELAICCRIWSSSFEH